MNTLRDRLDDAMRVAGIPSQRQLAFKANLRPATITRWVQGETKTIRPNDIRPVAKILGVSPDWLLTGQGPRRFEGAAETPLPYQANPLDTEMLTLILEAVQMALETRKVKLSPRVVATLVATLYEMALQEASFREDLASRIQPFIRLALAGAG